MLQLVETKLMTLIKESTSKKLSISELESAYESFASTLFAASGMKDKVLLHNSLRFVRAEFASLQSQIGVSKKMG
jgi:hypothetical protein